MKPTQTISLMLWALITVLSLQAQNVTTTGGTANAVPKFSGSTTIVNSALVENGGNVGIGTATPSASLNIARPGAASRPGLLLDGSWFTGGTTTNNLPHVLIQPAGTTSNNWTALGTALGINAPANFTGYLIKAQSNGVNVFKLSYNGVMSTNYIGNPLTLTNSMLTLGNTGSIVSRSIADTNPALIVQQQHASSTGDILDLKNSAATVLVVKRGGNVGIGTTSPTSLLTVAGAIQSTAGGFKFPDNTVQTTATLVGPPGMPGAPGTQGPPGPQGPPGTAAILSGFCQQGNDVSTNTITGVVIGSRDGACQFQASTSNGIGIPLPSGGVLKNLTLVTTAAGPDNSGSQVEARLWISTNGALLGTSTQTDLACSVSWVNPGGGNVVYQCSDHTHAVNVGAGDRVIVVLTGTSTLPDSAVMAPVYVTLEKQ